MGLRSRGCALEEPSCRTATAPQEAQRPEIIGSRSMINGIAEDEGVRSLGSRVAAQMRSWSDAVAEASLRYAAPLCAWSLRRWLVALLRYWDPSWLRRSGLSLGARRRPAVAGRRGRVGSSRWRPVWRPKPPQAWPCHTGGKLEAPLPDRSARPGSERRSRNDCKSTGGRARSSDRLPCVRDGETRGGGRRSATSMREAARILHVAYIAVTACWASVARTTPYRPR